MADDIIASAWVRIRAMADTFGADVKKAVQKGASAGDADAAKAGQQAGGKFGDGFNTGTSKRVGNSKATFTKYGQDSGAGFASGFGSGLNKLALNVWSIKTLAGALKSVTGPALIATKAIGIAGAAGAAIALGGAGIGVVGALSQIAGVAPVAVAALGAVAIVSGTVKLATMGVSQAFKDAGKGGAAYAKDLKGLAPNAQQFVKAMVDLKPTFDSLQKGVQNNFFAGLAGGVKNLLGLLPQVKVGLGGISTAINGDLLTGLHAVDTSFSGGGLQTILTNIAKAVAALKTAITPVVGAFATIGITGSKYLAPLAGQVGGLAKQFGAFIQKAAESGKLDAFIQGGIHAFQTLAGIVTGIGAGIGNVIRAAAPLGGLLLGKLDLVAQGFKTITSGPGNQKELTSFFTGLQPLLSTLGGLLTTVVKALEPLLPVVIQVAQVLGSGLTKAITDLSPGLVAVGKIVLGLAGPLGILVDAVAKGLSAALISLVPVIKPVAAAFTALAPVLGALISNILTPFPPLLADVAKAVQILAPAFVPLINILGTLINGALSALAPVLGIVVHLLSGLLLDAVKALQPIMPSIVAAFTLFGQTLAKDLAPLLPVLVKAFAQILVALIPLVPVFVGLLVAGLPVIAMLAKLAADIIPPLMKILVPLLPVIAGIATVFLLWGNPIGEAIVLIAGIGLAWKLLKPVILGAVDAIVSGFHAFINFFTTTLPNAFSSVLDFLKVHWKLITEIILLPFAPLAALILKYWTPIKGAFESAFNAIAGAAQAAWGVIKSVFDVGMKVLEVAAKIVFAVVVGPFILAFDGLKIAFRAFWGWVGPYVTTALHAVGAVVSAGVHAISAVWSAVWGAIKHTAAVIWNAIVSFFRTAFSLFSTTVRFYWNGIKAIITTIWGAVSGPVKAVWRALSSWFSTEFSNFKTGISNIWHGIVGAIHTAWNAVTGPIKTTWNKLSGWIFGVWETFKTDVGTAWGHIADKITGAFSGVAGAISTAWDGIKSAFTTPINFIINKVIDPFLKAIHKIPGVPLWHIDPISTGGGGSGGSGGGGGSPRRATMAHGGVLGGYAPGRDTVHVMASPGEGWLIPEAVKGLGPDFVHGANAFFGRHRGVPRKGASAGAFGIGGIVGGIKDLGGYAWSGAKAAGHEARQLSGTAVGGIVRAAEHVADASLGQVPGGDLFSGMASGIMGKLADGVENFIKGKGKKQPKGGAGGINVPKGSAVGRWAGTVKAVLAQLHQPANLVNAVLSLIGFESGGNARAVNKSDINWRNGTPSVGLAQVIGPTFRRWAGPYLNTGPFEYGVSENPKANVYAGLNYGIGRYDAISNIPGIQSVEHGGGYQPYDTGGWLNPGATMAVNKTGKREAVMPQDVMVGAIRQELGGSNTVGLLAQIEQHLAAIAQFTAMSAASGGGDTYGGPTYG